MGEFCLVVVRFLNKEGTQICKMCLKYFEGASSSDSDVHRYVIVRTSLDFTFNIRWEPESPYWRPRWTYRDFSSVRLLTQDMSYPRRCYLPTIKWFIKKKNGVDPQISRVNVHNANILNSKHKHVELYTLLCKCTVAYLLKARTVEPEKQPLLGSARSQQ
jgi:hypothetical protein